MGSDGPGILSNPGSPTAADGGLARRRILRESAEDPRALTGVAADLGT